MTVSMTSPLPRRIAGFVVALCLIAVSAAPAGAQALGLFRSYEGQVAYTGGAGTFRTQANSGNACAVGPTSTIDLSGIPNGAGIEAAYVYWAGSGATADFDVTLDGGEISAERTFQRTFRPTSNNLSYFQGVTDITTQVDAKRDGTYTLTDLDVNNGTTPSDYCGVEAVVKTWAIHVVYRDPSRTRRSRVNLYEGFRIAFNQTQTNTISDFETPGANQSILTTVVWEGDPAQGTGESVSFATPGSDARPRQRRPVQLGQPAVQRRRRDDHVWRRLRPLQHLGRRDRLDHGDPDVERGHRRPGDPVVGRALDAKPGERPRVVTGSTPNPSPNVGETTTVSFVVRNDGPDAAGPDRPSPSRSRPGYTLTGSAPSAGTYSGGTWTIPWRPGRRGRARAITLTLRADSGAPGRRHRRPPTPEDRVEDDLDDNAGCRRPRCPASPPTSPSRSPSTTRRRTWARRSRSTVTLANDGPEGSTGLHGSRRARGRPRVRVGHRLDGNVRRRHRRLDRRPAGRWRAGHRDRPRDRHRA